MPDVNQFAGVMGVPVEHLRTVSEEEIRRKDSQLHAAFIAKVAQKWTAMIKAKAADGAKKKTRVYLTYALKPTQKYTLAAAFPQFDVRYSSVTRVSAAMARATSQLVSEVLLQFAGKQGRQVLLVGYQLRPALLRNRSWATVCVLGADPRAQTAYKTEDRELAAIYTSMTQRHARVPDALVAYMTGASNVVQTDMFATDVQANVSCFMLDHLDISYQQLAEWMHCRNNKMALFAIPGDKTMELAGNGAFSELDAYVVSADGRVTLMFPDDMDFQRTYTHANYLSLITRVRLVYRGFTYTKEFIMRKRGYLVFKVTRFPGEHSDDVPIYRSWYDPTYKDKVALITPTLRPGGTISNPKHWSTTVSHVSAALVNSVLEMALYNSDAQMDGVVARKINSVAHNYLASGVMVRQECPLSLEEFQATLYAVYGEAFMRKYAAAGAVRTLAPQARARARLPMVGLSAVLGMVASTTVSWAQRSITAGLRQKLVEYVELFEPSTDSLRPVIGPMPGYIVYSDPDDPGAASAPGDAGPLVHSPFLPSPKVDLHVSDVAVVLEPALSESQSGGFFHDAEAVIETESVKGTVGPSLFNRLTAGLGDFTHDPWELAESDTCDEVPPLSKQAYDATLGRIRLPSMLRPSTYLSHSVESIGSAPLTEQDQYLDRLASAAARVSTPLGTEVAKAPILGYVPVEIAEDPQAYDAVSDAVVARVMHDYVLPELPVVLPSFNAHLAPSVDIRRLPGMVSDNPHADYVTALGLFFPKTGVVDVSGMESHRNYTDLQMIYRAIRLKIDISKIDALKPDAFYLPVVPTHVPPKVKETTRTVAATLGKRNANTPYSMDPASQTEMFKRAWAAMLDVFYVPGAQEKLRAAMPIVLTVRTLRQWLDRQEPTKRERLANELDYSLPSLVPSVKNVSLMLKGKIKPPMEQDYDTAIKLPQSIQFDQSGRTVALISPVIREKVKRQQMLLKPNILVMQGKSPEDLVRFLNQFDHRVDHRGRERRYIEIDQTMFDKAQVTPINDAYGALLAVHGVTDDVVGFVRDVMSRRNASSAKTGVSISLADQNMSGAAFTLDRNNDVSLFISAELVQRIIDQLEFMCIMGDDILIAVRGTVDVSDWERTMNRRFNMNPKVSLRDHGYFCSYEVCHLPGGRTTIARDPVKAALSTFSDLSFQDREQLHEKWLSYVDSMTMANDLNVQLYLSKVLSARWRLTCPLVTPEAVLLLLRVHASVMRDESALHGMYAEEKTRRLY